MSQTVNFFWHGPRFRRLELACITSFHQQGHPVRIHGYEKPENLPGFAEWFDASKLMPIAELVRNRRSNSVALGANRYRYLMIEAGFGLYSDCDVYCLSPVPDRNYLMGWQTLSSIANGFLRFPPGGDLGRMLIEHTSRTDFIPPWTSPRSKIRLNVKRLFGKHHVSDMPWGVWGPKLLTYAIKELSLEFEVQPIDTYYAFPSVHFPLLFEPSLSLRDLLTSRSIAIHLWNDKFTTMGIDRDADAPSGSPLDEIYRSAGV